MATLFQFILLFVLQCTRAERHACIVEAYQSFHLCMSGPGVPYVSYVNRECGDWDDDLDGDVDLLDARSFFEVRP